MLEDEIQIRSIIEKWALAVRQKDMAGILANHSEDIVMYDVPPPFESRGIEAYRSTWKTFFDWEKDSHVFDIIDLQIVAGNDVAFGYATMRCKGFSESGEEESLQFRLTVGLKNIDSVWMIAHEHHSIPSE